MAAKVFTPNPIHSPSLIRDKPQQNHKICDLSMSKTISKRNSVSSSIMSPPIHSSPLAPLPSSPSSSSSSFNVAPLSRAFGTTLPLSRIWREIQGSNNWENLIDPLSPILQQEITRYGNLLSASYKGFDLNPNSKRYLNCKYGKKNLLKASGINDPYDYQVTKYIYATPDININPIHNEPNQARWIGFVAVSSDESVKRLGRRDIVVTFRGTVTNPEWLANLMSSLTPAKLDPHNPRPDVKVESGFLSLYTSSESESKFGLESCREQLLSEIMKLMNKYKGEEMSITLAGHSMGSSLAHLLAYDIAELGINQRRGQKPVPVTVFSFAGPRVGNLGFKKRCEQLGVKVLRITNKNDPITKLPGFLFNENFRALGGVYELPWSCSCYTHVGIELTLDFFDVQNISCVHDLETYINLVNRPRCSKLGVKGDNFGLELLNRTSEMMLGKGKRRALQLRNAATNAAYLLCSVSNHMSYLGVL